MTIFEPKIIPLVPKAREPLLLNALNPGQMINGKQTRLINHANPLHTENNAFCKKNHFQHQAINLSFLVLELLGRLISQRGHP